MNLLVCNGNVWQGGEFVRTDIQIRDGVIERVGAADPGYDGPVIDAQGFPVLPGFIDMHTHLDDTIGPYALADDIASGTRVAVENGITTVGTFVTETPEIPLTAAFARMTDRIHGHAYGDVAVHVTPTRFDAAGWRAIEDVLSCGIRTIKLYTTYRAAGIYSSYDELDRIFATLQGRALRVLVHCEDDLLLQAAAAEVSDWTHPSAHAQVAAIRAVLERAAARSTPLHTVHVSTPEGADLIAAARHTQDVTCETGPQYLTLDSSWLDRGDGHRWICSPALRTPALVKQMANRARDGVFDVFASDHCPFLCEDKDAGAGDVRTVPNGIPGIGALPHLAYAALHGGKGDPLLRLGTFLSETPARVMGLYPRKGSLQSGADADIIILSPDDDPHPIRSSLAETYEPYPGFLTRLRMHSVLVHGIPVVHDGFLLDPDHPQGSCTWES